MYISHFVTFTHFSTTTEISTEFQVFYGRCMHVRRTPVWNEQKWNRHHFLGMSQPILGTLIRRKHYIQMSLEERHWQWTIIPWFCKSAIDETKYSKISKSTSGMYIWIGIHFVLRQTYSRTVQCDKCRVCENDKVTHSALSVHSRHDANTCIPSLNLCIISLF